MNTLPPRRTMPDDVRERLRTRVLGDRPARSRQRGLLAAAAAVVLVAGGLVLSTSIDREQPADTGHRTTSPTVSRLPLTPPPYEGELDRCWAALVDAGKTDGYPDRSEWLPVIGQGAGDLYVTAAWAAGQPLFCQTTASQVIVSDPNAEPQYVGSTGTGLLLRTDFGGLGGVVDPDWSGAGFTVGYADGSSNDAGADHSGGLFVAVVLENLRDPRISVEAYAPGVGATGQGVELPLDAAPGQVAVADRPGQPNEFTQDSLTRCLQNAGVPDIASWGVGAEWLGRVGGRILGGGGLLTRNGDRVGLCDQNVSHPDDRSFIDLGTVPMPAADEPPIRLRAPELDYPAVMGLVSATAAYVDVYFGDFSLRTTVVNSTFGLEDAGAVTRVEVFDRDDELLYSGPFSEGG